jgi:hypothetical protein
MSFTQFTLFNTNSDVYQDAAFGIKDPLNNRSGWYFKNDQPTKKINWYFFDSNLISPLNINLPNFSAFAVVTLDSIASRPFLSLYSKPTGSGDIIPNFAKSSRAYIWPNSQNPIVGTKYLIYFGQNPDIYNDLERVELVAGPTNGTFAPTEEVNTVAFSTDSGASVNNVQLIVERLGINTAIAKATIELLITPLSPIEERNAKYQTENESGEKRFRRLLGLGYV